MGCEHVIDRKAAGYKFWSDEHTQDEKEWRRLGKDIRDLIGRDVDIVFEHPGRSTIGASVFVTARGGKIVTCAATSGYMIEYDNRHLWMKLKSIVSSHFANYRRRGRPTGSSPRARSSRCSAGCTRSTETGDAALAVHQQRGRGQGRRAVPRPRGGPRHRRPRAPREGRRGQDHPLPPPRGLTPSSATPSRAVDRRRQQRDGRRRRRLVERPRRRLRPRHPGGRRVVPHPRRPGDRRVRRPARAPAGGPGRR